MYVCKTLNYSYFSKKLPRSIHYRELSYVFVIILLIQILHYTAGTSWAES